MCAWYSISVAAPVAPLCCCRVSAAVNGRPSDSSSPYQEGFQLKGGHFLAGETSKFYRLKWNVTFHNSSSWLSDVFKSKSFITTFYDYFRTENVAIRILYHERRKRHCRWQCNWLLCSRPEMLGWRRWEECWMPSKLKFHSIPEIAVNKKKHMNRMNSNVLKKTERRAPHPSHKEDTFVEKSIFGHR